MKGLESVLVVGQGAIGLSVAEYLLNKGHSVRMWASPHAPIAAEKALGVIERQGMDITICTNGQTYPSHSSLAWEDMMFKQCEQWLLEGKPWIAKAPVVYHRMKQDEDAFESPFKGMEPRVLEAHEVIPPYLCGFEFTGYLMNVRSWLESLRYFVFNHKKFLGLESRHISSPEEVDVSHSVIACGLGQRAWDPKVYPSAGETLLVKAPNVDRSRLVGGIRPEYSGNVLPLPGSDNLFLIGAGKREGLDGIGDFEPYHDKIFEAAIEVCPQLQGAEILERRIGVRPKREGGVRIDLSKSTHHANVMISGWEEQDYPLSAACAAVVYKHLL